MKRIDLVNRAIPRALFGYDRLQVDRLMQDLSDALARVTDEKITLAARAKDLEARLVDMKDRESALQQTLVAGQRMGEDLRASAHKEAQLILESARVKADGILQDANTRLARIMQEMMDAKKAKAQFEMKLKAVIEDHLRLLQMGRKESASLETAMRNLDPDTRQADGPGVEKDGEKAGAKNA